MTQECEHQQHDKLLGIGTRYPHEGPAVALVVTECPHCGNRTKPQYVCEPYLDRVVLSATLNDTHFICFRCKKLYGGKAFTILGYVGDDT